VAIFLVDFGADFWYKQLTGAGTIKKGCKMKRITQIIIISVLSLSSAGYSDPGTIMLDFDKTGDVNTEPGFTSFLMSDSGTTVNGITIDLIGDINDARRATPNSGSGIPVYTEEIYRDFVYGVSSSGVTITLGGLGVNQECDITIYAFDDGSEPNRIADWSANGSYLFTTDFIGGDGFRWPSPWWGIDYKFGPETATADKYGTIVLTSTKNPSSPVGEDFAFVNALVVAPKGTYVQPLYAQHPSPSDGVEEVPVDVNLEWNKGKYAATHDIYLGSDFDDINDANRSNPLDVLVSQGQTTTIYDPPESLDSGTTYYWRIDEVNAPTIWKGKVWSFTTHVPILIAHNPAPVNGAQDVPADVNLTWEKGDYAETHDVYLGMDEDKVTDANRSNPLGVLVSEDQTTVTYDPPESLDSDTTYYWRIDEVNGAPDFTIFKGEVWSFRVVFDTTPRTIDAPYEVGTWQGFKTAAITYTFDDGRPSLYSTAIPMFDEPNFGFNLTAFIVTEQFGTPDWPALADAAGAGHEIASHTVTHPSSLGGLTIAEQTAELADSQNTINSQVPGQQCRTLAYPNCNPGDGALTAKYYIAARGCSGVIEASTPTNFYNTGSFICGTGGVNSLAAFTLKFTSAASSQGWCTFLIHGLDGDTWYSPLSSTVLRESLEYLAANRSTFWVQTFGNVVRYIRERNNVSVTELSNEGKTITLQVTDNLNNANYNYPITIRRPLPAGWPDATVSQNGQPVDACSVMVGPTKYIMFDVVPDGGNVVLISYGDFTGNGIVDMNDFSVFRSYWLLDDCGETAGVDLNGDCLVNFYEYAFLAENWLLQEP